MIANQNFYDTCFTIFYPTASATVYGRRPKFFRAEHSATAEGENCAYGPTLEDVQENLPILKKNASTRSHCLLDGQYGSCMQDKPAHFAIQLLLQLCCQVKFRS